MTSDRNDKLHDDLTRVLGSDAPQADFGQWRQTHSEAIAQLDATAGKHQRKTITERFMTMRNTRRIAAAVLGCLAIAGAIAWLTISNGGASTAWAKMQATVRSARTMTMKMEISTTMHMQNGETIETTRFIHVFAKEPGLMRQEIAGSVNGEDIQAITVMDTSSEDGMVINLIPSMKMATRINIADLPAEFRGGNRNHLTIIKKLVEGSNEPLGEKEIDGRNTTGFRVTQMEIEADIWVDSETGLPVLIEGEIPGFGTVKMTDYAFDMELDDELFDTTIPEGYTVQEMNIPMGDGAAAGLPEVPEKE